MRPEYDPRRDAYAILHVAAHAHPDVVEAAHRALVKLHHPDRGGNSERMAIINAAYDLLKDPDARRDYDADREAEIDAYISALRRSVRSDPEPDSTAPTMPFGKYTGYAMTALPDDYLDWLVNEAKLRSSTVRRAAEREFSRRFST